MDSPHSSHSDRTPLSRERILAEAVAMMDEDGLDAVTMRSLGARMGVRAMALYRYVNGREDLLEGVVDGLLDDVSVEPDEGPDGAQGWQGLLQWVAHSVRDVAVRHPNVFPLIVTRHPAAPWLRPPLRSVRVVEDFLSALTARGFSDEQAVRTYRVFTGFLLGHLLLEAAVRRADLAPPEVPLDEGDASVPSGAQDLDLSDFPVVARTAGLMHEDHTEQDFEEALEELLERLDHDLSQ